MVSVLLFTALIVVLIFFYMLRKAKARRNGLANINSVRDYHAAYDRVRTRRNVRDRQNNYQTYVTKYNSSEDYRERIGSQPNKDVEERE